MPGTTTDLHKTNFTTETFQILTKFLTWNDELLKRRTYFPEGFTSRIFTWPVWLQY